MAEEMHPSEQQWLKERAMPLFRVRLLGDEVPFAPRADERYWHEEDGKWVPNEESDLPEDAKLVDGQVVRQGYCTVDCRAKTEQQAVAFAMSREPDYHTLDSVEQIGEGVED